MLTILSFVVALGLLIAVHEYGHYRVAVLCGVRVLRFSIGFGSTVARWKIKGSETEFVIGAFPFGGYVKMLDERESPVEPALRHLAFDSQRLRTRAAIVAAGPAANLMLAVLLYTLVNWIGVQQPAAVLGAPVSGSIAQRAGLVGGERVSQIALGDANLRAVESFDDLRWLLTRAVLQREDVRLTLQAAAGRTAHEVTLPLSQLDLGEADAQLLTKIGLTGPMTRPVIGAVTPGAAAQRAGLLEGDLVLMVDKSAVTDGQALRQLIRLAVRDGQTTSATWLVQRAGAQVALEVRPELKQEAGVAIARIGAYVGSPPEMVTVRFGVFDGIWRGIERTWEVSALTLQMMGKMLIGEASLKNLSGPLTIADYAGKSASLGLTAYLLFLALISVSLGVLNLLPLPVLDGGHLLYYLYEGVTGKPVSERWMARLQQGGVAALILMTAIALFNDFSRLIG